MYHSAKSVNNYDNMEAISAFTKFLIFLNFDISCIVDLTTDNSLIQILKSHYDI
jgi:hypothetical protein